MTNWIGFHSSELPEPVRRTRMIRVALVIAAIVIWNLLIGLRLIQLQILQHEQFEQLARERQELTRAAAAPRGIIYDRWMNELARNAAVSMVVAEPRRIRDLDSAVAGLAGALDLDPSELKSRMTDPDRKAYLVVKHRIDPRAEARIEELGIEGVYLIAESMRVYPNRDLACHVLGFVNANGDGAAGLEMQYDRDLKGSGGVTALEVDAHRRSFRGRIIKPSRQGQSLVLSLDRSIQYVAERELAAAVAKQQAAAGAVVVMETETGRILALANYPDFNCNTYGTYDMELWRNRAVSDIIEPGSTFKVVVAAAALEAGLTHPSEIIDCQMGSIRVGRHVFHDHRPYGPLTFNQVLEYSSNVGATKLAMRLGEARLYDTLMKFGFGSRTAVDLPAEATGLVRSPDSWSALSVGAISFGQEIGVSSIQMLTAINVIASGGFRLRPYLVDRVIDAEGNLLRSAQPDRTRIISARTAAAVSSAFEGVVLRGTGRDAALEGYRAAGKTGTAQKIVNGVYSDTDYLSSFIGYAPLPNPRVTILVQIDSPKGDIYGGTVAAPVFRKIAQEILLGLRIPPDMTLPPPKPNRILAAAAARDFVRNATPVAPIVALPPDEVPPARTAEIVVRLSGHSVVVPDFRGYSKRRALDRCQELGIQMQSSGSGIAISQSPAPGSEISVGEACSITFARANSGAMLRSHSSGGTQLAQSSLRAATPHP